MARSNDGGPVYIDATDRETFLDLAGRMSLRHGWSCLAYCLMGNHFHIAVTTAADSLSAGMRDLLAVYAKGFNRRHDRVGRLFRERFLSVPITTDRQLAAVMRYLALNPVRAGLAGAPDQWRWSSYPVVMGRQAGPALLRAEAALSLFSGDPSEARRQFAALVAGSEDGDLPVPQGDITRATPGDGGRLQTVEELLALHGIDEGIRVSAAAGHSQTSIARHVGISASAVNHRLRSRR